MDKFTAKIVNYLGHGNERSDYPAFLHKQSSFIEVMEDFYIRMRKSNQKQM